MDKNNKMRLRLELPLLLILFIPLLSTCKASSPAADMPDTGIPEYAFNTKFRLEAPLDLNTFKTNSEVVLVVEVVSQDPVVFQFNYGARLFMQDKNGWSEINNKNHYPKGEMILYPANGDPFKLGIARFYPDLPDPDKPANVRIILTGNVYHDNKATNEVTATYIDVRLIP
jgi:hypothetical protein